MGEGDSMQNHIVFIHDLREQLLSINEVIPDIKVVTTTLTSLKESYSHFHASFNLSLRRNLVPLPFQEHVGLLFARRAN